MKLFERHDAEQVQEQLPQLPPGVEVPDDISGIHPPETPTATTGGVRWMRWLVAILLLGAAAGVTVAVMSGDDAVETPAQPAVDLMQKYGTDNPTIIPNAPPPGIAEITPAEDYMALYGTDNPVFVPNAAEANSTFHGEYMRLYGTDNPTFVEIDPMQKWGTDNPDEMP